jgi:hypothetical protein
VASVPSSTRARRAGAWRRLSVRDALLGERRRETAAARARRGAGRAAACGATAGWANWAWRLRARATARWASAHTRVGARGCGAREAVARLGCRSRPRRARTLGQGHGLRAGEAGPREEGAARWASEEKGGGWLGFFLFFSVSCSCFLFYAIFF